MATMDHLDGDWAVGFDLADTGMRALMVAGAKDGDAYIADYRKLLERQDIEVVAIATHPGWHALISIAAMEAGKRALDAAGIQIPFPHLQLFWDDVEPRVIDKLSSLRGREPAA